MNIESPFRSIVLQVRVEPCGPYLLWQSEEQFGAEFRFVDETGESSTEIRIRIPVAGFALLPPEQELLETEIASRCRSGTKFVLDGSIWRLRRAD